MAGGSLISMISLEIKPQTTPDGDVITYSYNEQSRVKEIDSFAGLFTFTYNALGRRSKLSYPNNVETTYSYNSAGHLIALVTKNSRHRTLNSYNYTYDKVGNCLNREEPHKHYAYTYDAIYQLCESLPGNSHGHINRHQAETFSYDKVGNRLTGPASRDYYTYNEGNRLSSDRNFTYIYDNNGNMVKKEKARGFGRHDKHIYTYDYEGRLKKVEIFKRDRVSMVVTFSYDPFGRRIRKTVEKIRHGSIVSGKKIYRYVYNNEDIILEYITKTGHFTDEHDDGEEGHIKSLFQ